jgi:hypothetical protein
MQTRSDLKENRVYIEQQSHAYQTDNFNCGVYVTIFAENLINGFALPTNLEQVELLNFRLQMYSTFENHKI